MTAILMIRPARNIVIAGIGLMLASVTLFSLNDAVGKWLVKGYPVGEALLIRSLTALVLLAPFLWREGLSVFTAAPRPRLQVLRAVISTTEVVCFFWSVGYLPLADVMTFYLAGPIYVTALAPFVLGEHVGWRRWAAVLVGFAGVLLALKPSAAALTAPALVALAGSLLYALLADYDTGVAQHRERRAGVDPDRHDGVVRARDGAARLGHAAARRFCADGSLRRAGDGRARVPQHVAQARAGVGRRALSIHDDRMGRGAGLFHFRRRAEGARARRRGHHHRRGTVYFLS
jgi:hypothetical protein